ncbi:MAG: type II toxin-antitoxin system HicB family antitoxin [Dehalococcoidia bacterium]|nr:type II toxin-antitoxin system HicB family antitoxin [Dehalococcoidia bacterium]
MKYVFTALFVPEPSETNKKLLSVYFPDLPGCHTCGDDLGDALYMAKDALSMWLYMMERENKPIPAATPPKDIKINGDEFITAIAADTDDYRRFRENKATKKSLTIPTWLNEQAEAANINFSQTLQKALKEELQLV